MILAACSDLGFDAGEAEAPPVPVEMPVVCSGAVSLGQVFACAIHARCAREMRCQAAFDTVDACLARHRLGELSAAEASILAAIDRGTVAYDAGAAAACLEWMAGGECTRSLTGAACARMFAGALADGDRCTVDAECGAGGACVGCAQEECCEGTCLVPDEAGDPCFSDDDCAHGRVCLESGACEEAVGQGGACGDGASCAPGLSCEGAICERTDEVGARCLSSAKCWGGLYCSGSGPDAGTCQARAARGEPCRPDLPCLPSSRCDPATSSCVAPSGPGGFCAADGDCAGALHCRPDKHRCTAPGPAGATCTATSQCEAGLVCDPSGTCLSGICP